MTDDKSASRITPPFYTSIACWIDLLGYGGMISRAGFSPIHPQAQSAIARLRRFHRIVADHSGSSFPTMVINDGAVAYRDLNYLSNDRTLPFLRKAWELFEEVNTERGDGQAGARMVIAVGFRMKGRRQGGPNEAARRREIVEGFQNGRRTIEQAVDSAARGAAYFDVVPQLQANFAFTTAYVAEESGSRGGLPGANCYVDMSLFNGSPAGLKFGEVIPWRNEKLDLLRRFAPLTEIQPRDNPATSIRTGYEVACALAPQAELDVALRSYLKNARQSVS